METKFTPGPWNREYGSITKDGEIIRVSKANISIPCGWETDESAANGHLISAAPDLYDALQAIVDNLKNNDYLWIDVFRQANDALKKARGEQ